VISARSEMREDTYNTAKVRFATCFVLHSCFAGFAKLKFEIFPSETSIDFPGTTGYYIPESRTFIKGQL
jgi:hypothetical protein